MCYIKGVILNVIFIKYTVKECYCSEKTMFFPKGADLARGVILKGDFYKIHSKILFILNKKKYVK